MGWSNVRNAGYLLVLDSLQDGLGIRKSKDFLGRVIRDFANSCTKYYDKTGELPFIYRERQIHSVLLPSISKVADAAFMEHPITRKGKQISGHGWLDYWVMYGNTTFLIELKHAWSSLGSKVVRKATRDAYSKAVEQLSMISPADSLDLCAGSNLVKIALVIIPFYQSSKNKDKLVITSDKQQVEMIFNSLVVGLIPQPNWCCMWLLHRKLQDPVKYKNSYEIYPCVGVIARVDNSLMIR